LAGLIIQLTTLLNIQPKNGTLKRLKSAKLSLLSVPFLTLVVLLA
jgi:hypothetical protein